MMLTLTNKKMQNAIKNGALNRGDYLVYQGNELARSFGNLSVFPQKILDYCFSSVRATDSKEQKYTIYLKEMITYFGMASSGDSYKRIVKAFHTLNEKTSIYLRVKQDNGDWGVRMTSLFGYIDTFQSGKVEFTFNPYVAPYVFELKENWYKFKLSELSRVKSKYTLILMKWWNANGIGKWDYSNKNFPDAVIDGSLEDWEASFLGSDDDGTPKHWPAGRFRQHVLSTAISELEALYPNVIFNLEVKKDGRKVVGYRLQIHSLNTNVPLS